MSRGPRTSHDRRRASGRPPTALALALVAIVLGTLVVAGAVVDPAVAAPTTDAEGGADDGDDSDESGAPAAVTTPQARLVLSDLTAVVGPTTPPVGLPDDEQAALPGPDVTARVLVENLTEATLADTTLVIELQTDVGDRPTLRARLAGESTGVVGTAVLEDDERIPTIAPRGVAQVSVRLSGEEFAFAPTPESDEPLRIRPLRFALLRGATVLDEVRTAVVGLAGASLSPIETSVVVPVDHEPTADDLTVTPAADGEDGEEPDPDDAEQQVDAPDGEEDEVPAALLPGGRVDRLTAAVEAAPTGTISMAPAPHTLEALVDAGPTAAGTTELVERLRVLAAADPGMVVSMPYALAAVPTLASDEDTRPLAGLAVDDGRRRLGNALGTAPSASHLTVAPQTPTSLDLVPGDLLVARWDSAGGVDLDAEPGATLPPATRTAVAPSGRTLRILVGDPWIEEVLTSAEAEHGAAVTAHRVVLETAAAFVEDPGTPGRSLAVVPPVAWEPPGQVASEMTDRLASAPWLRLAAPATVVQRSTEGSAGWAPTPEPSGSLTDVLPLLAEVTDRFDLLATAVPADDEPVVFRHRDDLLVAMTTWPAPAPAVRARGVLADITDALDEVAGVLTVPDDTTVTLASERGVVPVTIRREAGPALVVVVEVSPQGRLVVEGEAARTVELEADGTATVGFDTRALGTGTFPLAVRVRTPGTDATGSALVLTDALISVRATAVSRPALLGVGLVVLVLIAFGGRRRRGSDDGDKGRHLEVVR